MKILGRLICYDCGSNVELFDIEDNGGKQEILCAPCYEGICEMVGDKETLEMDLGEALGKAFKLLKEGE